MRNFYEALQSWECQVSKPEVETDWLVFTQRWIHLFLDVSVSSMVVGHRQRLCQTAALKDLSRQTFVSIL